MQPAKLVRKKRLTHTSLIIPAFFTRFVVVQVTKNQFTSFLK